MTNLRDLVDQPWDAVRLSIAVQHTPTRDDDPVFQELIRDLPTAAVITDPDPGSDYASTWRTYRECLRRTPYNATHRLIVQDDVKVCRNFFDGVHAAIKSRPDQILSFFISMRPQVSATAHLQALDQCNAWSVLDSREWTPTQALCWPRFMIGPILRHADAHPLTGTYVADDQVISAFLRDRGMYALQSCPSLVEHVHAESSSLSELPATVNRVGDHRYAACYFGSDGDTEHDPAEAINWNRGPL